MDVSARREYLSGQGLSNITSSLKMCRSTLHKIGSEVNSVLSAAEEGLQESFYWAQLLFSRSIGSSRLLEAILKYLTTFEQKRAAAYHRASIRYDNDLTDRLSQQTACLEQSVQNLLNLQRSILAKIEYIKETEAFHLSNLSLIRQDYGNLVSQKIAKAAKWDSEVMRGLAEDMKKDSSSMKAIALLTMVFLPSTFVSVSRDATTRTVE